MIEYPPTSETPQHKVIFSGEKIPTQCWAMFDNGIFCGNLGVGDLGLCMEHRMEILGHY